MGNRRTSVVIAGVVVCLGLAGSRAAQADSPTHGVTLAEPVAAERSGMFFGASIGRGSLDITGCQGCSELDTLEDALSLSVHGGVLLNPSLALVAEGWLVRFNDRDNLRFADSSDHLISQQSVLGGAQVWLGPVWLRAGLGLAWHETDLEYPRLTGPPGPQPAAKRERERTMAATDRIAPAAGAALGLELARTPTFAFELAVRSGAARHDEVLRVGTTAITIGGTWY